MHAPESGTSQAAHVLGRLGLGICLRSSFVGGWAVKQALELRGRHGIGCRTGDQLWSSQVALKDSARIHDLQYRNLPIVWSDMMIPTTHRALLSPPFL